MRRIDVITTARSWLDTPFKHQGRVKGVGVDCVGVPLCVAEELHVHDRHGVAMTGKMYSTYPPQPDGNYVHKMCQKHLVQKSVQSMKAGDVVSMNVVSAPCHTAILGSDAEGKLTLIHAYSGGLEKVVEQPLDVKWQRRIAGVFEFPGLED